MRRLLRTLEVESEPEEGLNGMWRKAKDVLANVLLVALVLGAVVYLLYKAGYLG